MKVTSLVNDGVVLVGHLETANGLFDRMRGLLGRSGLGCGKGMYLSPCMSVHTFFMRFSIDLVFLDGNRTVVSIHKQIKPWHIVWGGFSAAGVVEIETGWFPWEKLKKGDRMDFSS